MTNLIHLNDFRALSIYEAFAQTENAEEFLENVSLLGNLMLDIQARRPPIII